MSALITMPNPHSISTSTAIPSLFAGRAWQQVLARDTAADGQFFYAVKSTKIFCKPSCPSRKPTRKNVTFFPTAIAAEAAGYRACLRCEPNRTAARPDPQASAIATVADYLKDHADERTRLADLAKATGVGRLTILRGFKRVLGVTPGEFAREQRLAKFKSEVREPRKRVTDAIYDAGYSSSSRLYENSTASLGMTPRVLREGGAGLVIRYTLANSPLGKMLVAATDFGICAILFAPSSGDFAPSSGNAEKALEADLRGRFSKAELVPMRGNSGWLAEAVAFVLSQLTESPTAATFPLDVRATAFQQRVWKALQSIPRGQTRSYGELARELGKPTASRAVAAACAANPVAIAVPCHRVVGSDGSLTGYRWGLDRKRKLLEAERV